MNKQLFPLCSECSKKVYTDEEKYITISTFDLGLRKQKAFYHFPCWADYLNNSAKIKIRRIMDGFKEPTMKSKTLEAFGRIDGASGKTNLYYLLSFASEDEILKRLLIKKSEKRRRRKLQK